MAYILGLLSNFYRLCFNHFHLGYFLSLTLSASANQLSNLVL